MTPKEKAHPTAATVGWAGTETAACSRAAISYNHSTTTPKQRQVVSEWLGVGEENGKTLKQLRGIIKVDPRSIRQQIERERRDVPILSGQRGYWIAASVDEVNVFCRSMRHRARQIWETARNVERSAGLTKHDQLEGQVDILEGGVAGGKTGDYDLL